MKDEEAREIFNGLIQALDSHKLSWITEQVREQIRFGKLENVRIVVKKKKPQVGQTGIGQLGAADINETEAIRITPAEASSRSGGTYSKTVEYTPQEQLLLLIDGIQRAIVDTAEMDSEIFTFFEATGAELNIGTALLTLTADDSSKSIQLSSDSTSTKVKQAGELKTLLESLRKEVSRDN